jgi:hypothetical protein
MIPSGSMKVVPKSVPGPYWTIVEFHGTFKSATHFQVREPRMMLESSAPALNR